MVKSRILRATGVALTSVGLVASLLTGVAGASSGSISNTGPDSSNKVLSVLKDSIDVNNDNHVSLMNNNSQEASSGWAKVSENTTGGGATSGNVTTNNAISATLNVTNHMPTTMTASSTSNTGTINQTGPSSDNNVVSIAKSDVQVNNDNSICLVNTNEQSASSGNAKVTDNTTGGSATTGSVSTNNSSTFSISISN